MSIELIQGNDRFAATEWLRQRVAGFADPSGGLNVERFDSTRFSFADWQNAVLSPPFLGPARLVVTDGVLSCGDFPADTAARMAAVLPGLPPTTEAVIVEVGDGPALAATNPVVAYVKANLPGAVRTFALPDKNPTAPMAAFVARQAEQRGNPIQPAAAQMLVELVGAQPAQLDSEVEKLSLYVGPGEAITTEAVRTLVPDTHELMVWDLMNAVAGGKTAVALGLLHSVLRQAQRPATRRGGRGRARAGGDGPADGGDEAAGRDARATSGRARSATGDRLGILALLARQLRHVLLTKAAMAERAGVQGAVNAINRCEQAAGGKAVGEWQVRGSRGRGGYLDQARRFDEGRLLAAYRALLEAELLLKSEAVDEDLILDLLIGELSGGPPVAWSQLAPARR